MYKKILNCFLCLLTVLGCFMAVPMKAEAHYDGVGTTYFEITYQWSKYDYKKVRVPLDSVKKYTVYKYKNSYYVHNGKTKTKTVNGKKVKYYYMQKLNKVNGLFDTIYVIDNSVNWHKNDLLWLKQGTFSKLSKKQYVLGSGFKGTLNYSKSAYVMEKNRYGWYYKWEDADYDVTKVVRKWKLGYMAS